MRPGHRWSASKTPFEWREMAFRWRAAAAGPSLNARFITDFSGDRDQNCWETLHFCDISGGGGRMDPRMSYGGESFGVHPFFLIVAPIVLGACLIMLFSVDERGHLGEKKQQQLICQRRRTVLCPWARHIYPCFRTGSSQEDPSRYIWKIVDWEVKNQIKQKQGRSQRILSCWYYIIWRIKIVDLVTLLFSNDCE